MLGLCAHSVSRGSAAARERPRHHRPGRRPRACYPSRPIGEDAMKRRDWMTAAGTVAAAAALDRRAAGAEARLPARGRRRPRTGWRREIVRLRLRHTWTTTMSSSEYRDTLQARYTRDGVTGVGEGAPIVRYHENAADAQKALEAARGVILAGDPWRLETLARRGLPPARGPVRGAGRARHRAARLGRQEARRPRLPPARPRPRERARSPRSRSASTPRRSRGRRCARPRSSRC